MISAAAARRDPAQMPLVLIVLLLGGANALTALGFDTTVAAFPALQAGLGADADAIQLTMTAFFIGIATGSLLHGPLADWLGRRPVLLGGLALYGLAAVGCALSHSAELLSVFRVLAGLAAASGQVIVRAVVRDLFDRDDSARVISYVLVVNGVLQITAPILGAYLTSFFGWRAVFVFLAGYGCVMFPIAYRMLSETLAPELRRSIRPAETLATFVMILQNRTYRIHLTILSSTATGAVIFLINSPHVLTGFFGLSMEDFGILFSTLIGCMLTARFVVARLVGRYTLEQLMFAGTVICATGGVAMSGLAFLGFDHPAAVLVPMYVVGCGLAVVMPQAMVAAMHPFREVAGAASSLLGFLQIIFGAAIGYSVGLFDQGNQLHMTTGVGIFPLIALYTFLRYVRPEARRDAGRGETAESDA